MESVVEGLSSRFSRRTRFHNCHMCMDVVVAGEMMVRVLVVVLGVNVIAMELTEI